MNLLLLMFVLNYVSLADYSNQVPDSFCQYNSSSCSNFSIQVAQQYFNGNKSQMNDLEELYVGNCHMVGSTYDKDIQHHGYFYFRKNQLKQYDFYGEFSFYANENPYLNLDIKALRIKHSEDSNYVLTEMSDHWQVNINPDPIWQYFLRFFDSKLQVIGFWGVDNAITCELQKIPNVTGTYNYDQRN